MEKRAMFQIIMFVIIIWYALILIKILPEDYHVNVKHLQNNYKTIAKQLHSLSLNHEENLRKKSFRSVEKEKVRKQKKTFAD